MKPEPRKMRGRCNVDMLGGIRYGVKNRDGVVEVVFPFMVLHGYERGHEPPPFVGRLGVDTQ